MILKLGIPDHHWVKPGVSLRQAHGFHQLMGGQHDPPEQPCPAGADATGVSMVMFIQQRFVKGVVEREKCLLCLGIQHFPEGFD